MPIASIAGLCFAMGADVRYTHAAASLGFTFVGLGLHPGMGSTFTISAAAGSQVASRMLLTGETVKGEDIGPGRPSGVHG